ncbi:lactase/phlorizin hydrolase-like [Anticarsia gemmatalis]|uniref:lactase/phlorizin hydrolase-like n=1 Tax=Anticarsia gemmatalis TaxID=129554 RepID=UPI003F7633A8
MLPKGCLLLLVSYLALSASKATKEARHEVRTFPDGFMFGASTASYQIEGAWDEDGKSESIWDHMTHNEPCIIFDCSNGDVADDSYHQYKRDVEMMRELGLDHYRFSIAWTRILPTSFPDQINELGVQYYDNLINEMLKYNIQPLVTLYHWDLPQRLQELGGWTNPHIVDWFGDYARVVFSLYGDRVKLWNSINEPREVCYQGYGADTKAPRVNIKGYADYMCTKNLLMAHARAYHIYNDEFRPTQGGSIFISLSAQFYEPETENDVVAAEETCQFEWGQYAHPIFSKTGDFPPIMKEKIAAKSAAQGFPRSRLPEFTPEEIEYVRGTSDFFGLNHYSTYLTYRNDSVIGRYDVPSYYDDLGTISYQSSEWEAGASSFLKVVPWGFYKLLTKIREDFDNPTVFVTENGYSSYGGLDDDNRISYYRQYINAMLDAIDEGSSFKGYTAWSIMDNFEWMRGYTERFGLYEVDYESPERTRTPRKSAFVYKEIIRSRALDWHYEPDTMVMTIDEGNIIIDQRELYEVECEAKKRSNTRLLYSILLVCGTLCDCKAAKGRHQVRKFPDGFKFGAATASYQVEGAWDEDGKSENIWDRLTHQVPSPIFDGSTGDVADDSYHQIKRDVEMMRELGLDFYRFSLSWARILPTSFPDYINEAGVQYYNNLIDEMLKYNIEPVVTLYHWDLPQKLQEMGGWTNPHMVDWYSDYARVVFELFGDRVKNFITINEPREVCYQGYGGGTMAPLYTISGVADYMCAKYLLLAHAKAYHIYDKEFRPTQGGNIFITLSASWYEPETEADEQAAEDTRMFEWGQYVHPIFSKTGDFPPVMKEKIAAKSAAQGFARSRLPELTPEEIDYIRGSSDFIGINHYSTYLTYRNASVTGYYDVPSYYDDMETISYHSSEWEAGASSFLKVVPWGFYKLLTKIRKDYDNPIVYITENGFSTTGGLDDERRISYYRNYLDAMLDAMDEGSDVRLYAAWSLMDNFEWMQGYSERFGLYEVDYESPERTRTPRKSAFVYKEILRSRALDWHYEPDTTVMTIDEGH